MSIDLLQPPEPPEVCECCGEVAPCWCSSRRCPECGACEECGCEHVEALDHLMTALAFIFSFPEPIPF